MERVYMHCVKVSEKAYCVADWLIRHYDIRPGYGLALHLNVARTFNNHDSVRVWVQRYVDNKPDHIHTMGDLRYEFVKMLPSDFCD